MKLRAALTAAIVVPSALALAGPVAPAHAATVCQGQPATIEGSTGILTGTEGNDVIVGHGTDPDVRALGGNDLICVEGGDVSTGLGDDSVVSTAPAGAFTTVYLTGGNDSYVSGPGTSDVIVDEVSSLHVVLGGRGTVELNPTSTPGTGTIEFGTASNLLYAFGEKQAKVDLDAQTASVDGLLHVTTTGLRNATATGCKVRMKGNDKNNDLDAYGHDVVVSGGGGRDLLRRVGNGFDLDLGHCGRYRSVFRGEAGPDHLYGRLGDDVLIGGPPGLLERALDAVGHVLVHPARRVLGRDVVRDHEHRPPGRPLGPSAAPRGSESSYVRRPQIAGTQAVDGPLGEVPARLVDPEHPFDRSWPRHPWLLRCLFQTRSMKLSSDMLMSKTVLPMSVPLVSRSGFAVSPARRRPARYAAGIRARHGSTTEAPHGTQTPNTAGVESHVSSLLRKPGSDDRRALAGLAGQVAQTRVWTSAPG